MKLFNTSRLLSFLILFFSFQNFYAQTAAQAQEMLDLVNNIRADNGIAPLVLNEKLNKAAFDHSNDMARNNYFSHTGLNNSSFSQRVRNAGYSGSPRGENIAAGNVNVLATFNQWKNSTTGHLENMLNANSNEMGIGYASFNGSRYIHYWTQVFGKGSGVLSNDDIAVAEINVYPNPVKDVLHIRLNNTTQEPLDVKLISINGQVVYHQLKTALTTDLKLNISNLPTGIYFLYFKNSTRKIVKL